ncbi:ABC transporter ATP-binding protein [Noviherbaspirillum pedocola]|uniref:ABC transporter ATP-binding protein n=1 Tax=Noviherbaspirillum pedocola TaxID=2801341 RepID=A0A934SYV3_9BURK|nr:ABC transporter ATP-binding protein [Noviherbaspirillum pedocola]MBK4739065.1 ABC transporter ATP-binding protein [Noviherbaspirillum pedocola]
MILVSEHKAAEQRSGADIVRVEKLSKSFGGPNVLNDISFTLERGRVHSIIGPNGAGKTTLLNVLTGLYRPTMGRVLVQGGDIGALAPYQLAALGVSRTFQNLKVCFNMTVEENVLLGRHLQLNSGFWAGILRLPSLQKSEKAARAQARELLEFVGVKVDATTRPDALSYGALKRLEIARALACNPQLILLDEPAAGLNPQETLEIKGLIEQLAEQSITVVLVEHDMKLVMGVSDNIVVINYGQKIAEGSPDAVFRNPEVIAAYLGARGQEETAGVTP